MRCTPEFIRVYNAIFSRIRRLYGQRVLDNLWKDIAPVALEDLETCVKADGLLGAEGYWACTLGTEGADFASKIVAGTLHLSIFKCPSMAHLGDAACETYCRHCQVMYPAVLKPLGYEFAVTKTGRSSCSITVAQSASLPAADTAEPSTT